MKNTLCITAAVVFISLLSYSCTNDDELAMPEAKGDNFKIATDANLQNELKQEKIDLKAVIDSDMRTLQGDPSNPKPPRN